MSKKSNIEDLLGLIYWVKTSISFDGGVFKHDDLLNYVESCKEQNATLNMNIYKIDNLMIDAYKLYTMIHNSKSAVFEVMNTIKISPLVSSTSMIAEIEKFEKIFENFLENYKYDAKEIRDIQKKFATDKMMSCVEIEDYENAAKFRDRIKEY